MTTHTTQTTAPTADNKPKRVLLLRTCAPDLTSYHGAFRWPESGLVECDDWNPEPVCGGGLHGLLWGEGDGERLDWSERARWLVVEADAADVVEIAGKVKIPRGVVVHCGDRESATTYLAEHGGAGRAICGGTATAGDNGTATAGYYGTATAGDRGTATAGDRGTATAGYYGIIQIRWWDKDADRYRIATGYIGEDGLLPGVPYRCDECGRFVRVDEETSDAHS